MTLERRTRSRHPTMRIIRHLANNNINNRSRFLRKMGICEEDVIHAEILMYEMPPVRPRNEAAKHEILLGYSEERLRRAKALRLLGITEEELDAANLKSLCMLGTVKSQKRRSLSLVELTQDQRKNLRNSMSRQSNIILRRFSITSATSSRSSLFFSMHSEGDSRSRRSSI
mmetsp:Transcript_28109/g.43748  ORF Transcript_28109/g.43748 Transcript_28109/m.43748 type:complete len:171 (+) Transcript_28109:484-996(+)